MELKYCLFSFLLLCNISASLTYCKHNSIDLYVDLVKKCILNLIYQDIDIYSQCFDEVKRKDGFDLPSAAHTMIGMKRINNLQECIEDVLKNNIEGDFIEAGVWRGGAAIFMRAMLKAYDIEDKIVWVADSFEGMHQEDIRQHSLDSAVSETLAFPGVTDLLIVPVGEVMRNFEKYDLLDDQVKFIRGWFSDSLPNAPIEKLAVARVHCTMYKSTMDALESLYHKISIGGYLIVDDTCWPGCMEAINDFRKKYNIEEEIIHIKDSYTGLFWKKLR